MLLTVVNAALQRLDPSTESSAMMSRRCAACQSDLPAHSPPAHVSLAWLMRCVVRSQVTYLDSPLQGDFVLAQRAGGD